MELLGLTESSEGLALLEFSVRSSGPVSEAVNGILDELLRRRWLDSDPALHLTPEGKRHLNQRLRHRWHQPWELLLSPD